MIIAIILNLGGCAGKYEWSLLVSVHSIFALARVNDQFSDTSIFRQPYYRVEKGTESRFFTEMIRPFCGTCSQKMKLLRPMTWTYKLKCTTV